MQLLLAVSGICVAECIHQKDIQLCPQIEVELMNKAVRMGFHLQCILDGFCKPLLLPGFTLAPSSHRLSILLVSRPQFDSSPSTRLVSDWETYLWVVISDSSCFDLCIFDPHMKQLKRCFMDSWILISSTLIVKLDCPTHFAIFPAMIMLNSSIKMFLHHWRICCFLYVCVISLGKLLLEKSI